MSIVENSSIANKMQNPSFILRKKSDGLSVTYEERPIPEVGPQDVLVEVKKTGVCGSDVHYWQHGAIGSFAVSLCPNGMCLGHESSGIVVKVGTDDKVKVKPGQRVAMEPGFGCGVCVDCKSGRYELCEFMTFAATPPFEGGTLCRYFKLPADFVHPISDTLSLEEGAMMEPLSVAVHAAAKIGEIKVNDNVIVFGCGPVGLLLIATAKALGARRIIAVDINQERLAFAKQYAQTDSFQPPAKSETESQDEYMSRVVANLHKSLGVEARGGNGIDLVLEASGAQPCITMGLHFLKPAGKFVQVGMGRPDIQIPVGAMMSKEIQYRTSFRYGPGAYDLAIDLVSQGKINLKELHTHSFAYNDALSAFDSTKAGKGKDGKSLIKAVIDGPEPL
ncbi:hypothetical protein E3P92_00361 [Wallemia ichthyophaga]|uniref:Enoyl reductase (ER) domain-containing protein n=2 Tax=Wallemia ichthyophaga TaxID=245174 RepID=A0A4T0F209_WALIC|nr:putative D-xylulose reductase A [Wallemia ichthyophaga EXF-994]TIA74821.1 hypothetical protein E3P91_00717 [Wallemia ichthyophaga]EOR00926.1 putative D-xylulose reductase A [Wallemia ichthyophaga EXF-994]TIA81631.1 hypothetical protein E3P98_01897 [Wallemia ichthyophaga]TIB13806.1 hypothetical protein E3P93_01812 [Wallemia ichthyophaga]TIB17007.1 hypothetical protein E3P90_00238 [Wallemia ichthyophaga]